jgi:nicotinate-nucleotide pyrophosphorylase (carboxylating)
MDWNALSLAEMYRELRGTGLVARLLELARDEDLGGWRAGEDWESTGDPTSRAITLATHRSGAEVVCREAGVVSGLAVIGDVLDVFRADVDFVPRVFDGDRVGDGAVLGELKGNTRGMLAVERTVLNLVGRLSGIATRTAEFVAAVSGTKAQILDTRKTTPGMRVLEKYAVRCGGGVCHRMGLYDAGLFKDNHLAVVKPEVMAATLAGAVRRAHDAAGRAGLDFVEVEVDNLEQLKAILGAGGCGCGLVLLDNMPPGVLREAVAIRDGMMPGMKLEASGGITLGNVAEVAATGVDRISLGTLTHGARWLDVGLDAA